MGFGSYDESEQEQPRQNDEEDTGETVTNEVKGENSEHDGKATMADKSTEEMMRHL